MRPRSFIPAVSLFVLAACASPENAIAPSVEASFGKTPAPTDPTAEFTIPATSTLGLTNDGVSSSYKNGVCGVGSKIFATAALSNSGDATMDTDNPTNKDAKCANWPRKLRINYGSVTELSSGQLLVHEVQNTTYSIPLGATVNRAMNFGDARCGGLKWRTHLRDGTFVGGDSVKVTRTSARTWHVYNSVGSAKAYCTATGALIDILVDFTITTDRDLPL